MHFSPAHTRLATLSLAITLGFSIGCAKRNEPAKPPRSLRAPSMEEVLNSGPDLWGEASLKQPGGPSYEYFENLLPPMRYCDAPFRHYPITLGSPNSPIKARLVSNGSAIN